MQTVARSPQGPIARVELATLSHRLAATARAISREDPIGWRRAPEEARDLSQDVVIRVRQTVDRAEVVDLDHQHGQTAVAAPGA